MGTTGKRASQPDGARWIDISVPLRDGMVHWPGDAPVRIERVLDLERGDGHTISHLSMGSHTGTHVDAPRHFIKGGTSIENMPLEITNGRARVLEIHHDRSIDLDELAPHGISPGERILFKTRNSSSVWKSDRFTEDFVCLSEEAARFLAGCRVRLVGIDYLSIGGFEQGGSEIHRILLSAGVWILEGLDLSVVVPGEYELVCLPLKLADGDGAPARAALRISGRAETGR